MNTHYSDDDRIQQLEFEYVTNSAQLYLVDVQHGILGHPKRLYDTMLNIDWTAVRREKFSPQYDPYRLVTKQHLQTPNEGLLKLRFVFHLICSAKSFRT